jgi:hypothetical protein
MRAVLQAAGVGVFAAVLLGCGAGHPTIKNLAISPSSATASAATHATVQFTAKATFTDNSSRNLTQADGLTWADSNGTIASIDESGIATCNAVGIVMVTGTAPVDLTVSISTSVSTTSPEISTSAQLTCM